MLEIFICDLYIHSLKGSKLVSIGKDVFIQVPCLVIFYYLPNLYAKCMDEAKK